MCLFSDQWAFRSGSGSKPVQGKYQISSQSRLRIPITPLSDPMSDFYHNSHPVISLRLKFPVIYCIVLFIVYLEPLILIFFYIAAGLSVSPFTGGIEPEHLENIYPGSN